ncbi:MAG TPA: NADH-quinone oxidoreductase subunit N [Dictyobacter sp.]|nr:NADH-quinone oxidoreductase subunit N [Dictyobacter sp.]
MTFTYTVQPGDWLGITPIVVLVIMALLVMLVDLVLPHEGARSKHSGPANFTILPLVSALGILLAIFADSLLFFTPHPTVVFNSMVGADAGTLYAYLIILTAGFLGVLLSPAFLKRLSLVHQGEYYALMLFAIVGMMLMAAATNFLIIFVGLEMFSLALYILCSFVAIRRASQESGMKYFLLSSFASAFLLYGIALVYASTGSTSLIAIKNTLGATPLQTPVILLVGLGLLSVGFAFKVSAVPFQTWTPDVYQGAPAPVTAFMSVGTKAAALLAFVRVFGFALSSIQPAWMPVIEALAILTIVGGNLMALGQSNIKRMLAYSSIAHGGYLLIGIVVGGTPGATAILFYLSCYLFMNLGAFGVISILEKVDNGGYGIEDLRGLWYRQPVLAGLLAFFLLALAGFPPMAGFAAKYYLFYTALQAGHPELLIIGIILSVLGIYYYLRFTATMFMEQGELTIGGIPITPRIPLGRLTQKAADNTTGQIDRGSTIQPAATPAGSGGTAVAVRPQTQVEQSPLPTATNQLAEANASGQIWMSWVALWIAAIGTLVIGVLLPLWLPQLQQAASQLLH